MSGMRIFSAPGCERGKEHTERGDCVTKKNGLVRAFRDGRGYEPR